MHAGDGESFRKSEGKILTSIVSSTSPCLREKFLFLPSLSSQKPFQVPRERYYVPWSLAVSGGSPTQVIPSHLTVHANFGIMECVEPVGGFSQAIAKYVFNIKKKRDLYINHIL